MWLHSSGTCVWDVCYVPELVVPVGISLVKLKSSFWRLYLCHGWPRMCSACHGNFPGLSLFVTYRRICCWMDTTDATGGARAACPSGTPVFVPGFWWGSCPFGHCVGYFSLIYGFWLPLWYLQTLLTYIYNVSNQSSQCPSRFMLDFIMMVWFFTATFIQLISINNKALHEYIIRQISYLMTLSVYGSWFFLFWYWCSPMWYLKLSFNIFCFIVPSCLVCEECFIK